MPEDARISTNPKRRDVACYVFHHEELALGVCTSQSAPLRKGVIPSEPAEAGESRAPLFQLSK